MNDIPEAALRTIEDTFGSRFVPHAADEAEPHAEQPFASVFPESAGEVESLMKLAEHHSIPLVARGAGTAPYSGKVPRVLVVRFDGMRDTRLPEGSGEDWVEVEPGVTWMVLGNRLREKGMGPTVYPTSAPRSTVGGWLAENGRVPDQARPRPRLGCSAEWHRVHEAALAPERVDAALDLERRAHADIALEAVAIVPDLLHDLVGEVVGQS
jgi:FAD binding domain